MNRIAIIVSLFGLALAASPAVARQDKAHDLPTGLQKKAARGQPLPPGWQKRLAVGEPLNPAVYEQSTVVVPVDDNGLVTVRVEGTVIRLFEATREIVQILEE